MTPESLVPEFGAAIVIAMLVVIASAGSIVRRIRSGGVRVVAGTTPWTVAELQALAGERELRIDFSSTADGRISAAARLPVVVVDGVVYARDPRGTESSSFQIALDEQRGSALIGGGSHSVTFGIADWQFSDRIDAAFERKYSSQAAFADRAARSATLRIDPLAATTADASARAA